MADLTRTVEIVFGANTDALVSEVGSLDSAFGGIGAQAQQAVDFLGSVADKALLAEASIIALGAAYGGVALKAAADFQASQVTLQRILGDQPAELNALSGTVQDLALQYGESSKTVFDFATNFLQAGFDAKEAGELTKNALDLMVAGDVSAEQATQTIIGTLKGFGAAVSDIPGVLDGLNSVVDKTAVNLGQLSEGMSIAAPSAKSLGFSWQETTAILTPIIEIFQSGSEAGTAFATSMGRLVDDSKPVQDALKALGVSQTDLNGNLRSGRDIFFDVQKAFQGLDSTQQLFYANQLVGLEQGKRLVLAFSDVNKTQEVLNITMNSSGSIAKEVSLQLATMEKQAARVGEAFNQMNAAVGTQLATNLGGVTGGITDLEIAFRKVVDSGGLQPLFDAINQQSGRLGEILGQIAQNLPQAFSQLDFTGLLSAFSGLGAEIGNVFTDLFGSIDITTPEGLADALQRIVNGLTALTNITVGIIDELRPIFQTIGGIIAETSNAGEESQRIAGQFLGAAKVMADFGIALGAAAVELHTFGVSMQPVGEIVGGVLVTAINVLQTAFDGIVITVLKFGKSVADVFDAITPDSISGPFKDASSQLGYAIDAAKENLSRNASEMVGGLRDIGQGFGLVGEEADKTSGTVSELGKTTGEAAQAAKGFEPIDLGDVDFVAKAAERLGMNIKTAAGATQDLNAATATLDTGKTEQLATGYTKFTDALGNVHLLFRQAKDGANEYRTVVDDLGNSYEVKLAPAISNTSRNLTEQNSKMDEATKKSEEFAIKLREIESKERIAFIEAKFKFDEAQMKADVEVIKAVFGSIDTAIKSTGDLIGSLTGNMLQAAKSGDRWNETFIQDQIRAEEKRRQATFDLQKQLTEQQIQYLKTRTQKALQGDALIKIEAQNLQQPLELIFIEIMKYVQVKANQEGLELLLGVA